MSSDKPAASLSGEILPQDAEGGVFARDASEEAIQEARRWAGKTVTISGVGGFVCVNSMNDFVVSTSFRQATALVVEPVDDALYGRGLVAFRVRDAHNKYLAVSPYGDDIRNEAAAALARVSPLLPEHISDVVNFATDEATAEGNFEGAGFNYRPLTATDGPPTWLQVFELEPNGLGKYGVRNRFGSYWRSEHWNKTVSQSPHCLGDERWRFTEN
uniref:Uncharacterized protein n=1 Tax=Odontella aurita TaxID=265563 RepID=A0A7S4MG46_9STRA|mmetsp:Transcript_20608/g.59835  ORF Transcript_20608/g.59835 Transcript_20608/m.59835 type:complete len:215 (+) Transcript_20608:234-878(+)|eukprot:CAMPEP_0113533442 /NCGR_PEP_ID=MMETSP0015_2-20120614/4609_1 /TAXON_ID=2838 /ORGANISM="Odontella" /LENGTH=214 /DNA_ID=CAMNT_0000432499 /DNA_START=213 /DNA_END=857 /DNA_ORIENTATION=+ /assembly_acc=CAM_ASM_000160